MDDEKKKELFEFLKENLKVKLDTTYSYDDEGAWVRAFLVLRNPLTDEWVTISETETSV